MDADERRLAMAMITAAGMVAVGVLLAGLVIGVAVRLFVWAAWG